jgi:signal transduction histidine kinase
MAVPEFRCRNANGSSIASTGYGTASAGSGIGLALVRSITAHHHAHIRLDDVPGARRLRVSVDFPPSAP